MSARYDVIVIGAGLAGLSAAVQAAQIGASVRVLELHELGGRAQSDERRGFTFNRGPHALFNDGEAKDILEKLGVSFTGSTKSLRGAKALYRDELHVLPLSITTILRTDLLEGAHRLSFARIMTTLPTSARAAFILVDVFGESYSSVATHLGRSEASCRQLVHRARAAVRGSDVSSLRPMDSGLLEQLVDALVSGDDDQLITLLSPDVVLTSDGGLHRRAARRPVLGRERVVRFLTNLSRREPEASALVGSVNFGACLYTESTKGPLLLAGSVRGSTIAHINLVMNPDKLQGADQPRLIV